MKRRLWHSLFRGSRATQRVEEPLKRAPHPFNRAIRPNITTHAEQICPITLENLAEHPPEHCIILIDGKAYQKEALLTWLKDHATAPATNENLANFAQRYRIRLPRQPSAANQHAREFFCIRVSIYGALLIISLVGFFISKTSLIKSDTAHYAVSSVSLSLMFFAASFLSFYVVIFLRDYKQPIIQDVQPPLLLNATPTNALEQVYHHYQPFLLPYDPDYYRVKHPTTPGSPS